MSIKPTKDGRYKVDYQDKFRGIARTKRTFKHKKEAQEWEAKLRAEGHANLMGRRPQRLFGEALTRYLKELWPSKPGRDDEAKNLRPVRNPFPDGAQWIWLEEVPLEAPNGAPNIISRLSQWLADQKAILKTSRMGGEFYQLRANAAGARQWWHQPQPAGSDKPPRRALVTDAALLRALDSIKGRGPYSRATLRQRQMVVYQVLDHAWRTCGMCSENLAGKITFEIPEGARIDHADYEHLRSLIIHAPAELGAAILGGVWLGLRRENLLSLQWPQIQLPVYETVEGIDVEIVPGTVTIDRRATKNKAPLVLPLSERAGQLFTLRWHARQGPYVFHRGDGERWKDFRKLWAHVVALAGLPAGFRWHDLRHTFASDLIAMGLNDRTIQELGGWKSIQMVQRYAHLRLKHLHAAANAYKRHERRE